MNLIHPGLQEVMMGSLFPSLIAPTTSVPSSRMVRSALKFVSKTASNFIRLQGRVEFPGNDGARRHAEFLAELGPDSRRLLDDHVFVGIVEGLPDLFGLALLVQAPRPGRRPCTVRN